MEGSGVKGQGEAPVSVGVRDERLVASELVDGERVFDARSV